MMRRMIADAIRGDPGWRGGEYATQPRGLADAVHVLMLMTSAPLQQQKAAPTRDAADSLLEASVARYVRTLDANDMLYAFDASRNYDPLPHLGRIRAPLYAINSADDEVNPPEVGILEREIRRVARGRYILIPTSDATRGHGTHSLPDVWGRYLAELLAASARPLKSASSRPSIFIASPKWLLPPAARRHLLRRSRRSEGDLLCRSSQEWCATWISWRAPGAGR
jgi:homoserine O-acetyltransferase